MQQRSGVDKFNAGGEFYLPHALIAAEFGGGEGEQRAQTLAAGGDEVGGELRYKGNRAVHPGNNRPVGGL